MSVLLRQQCEGRDGGDEVSGIHVRQEDKRAFMCDPDPFPETGLDFVTR